MPIILQYFIPGYIGIYIFRWMTTNGPPQTIGIIQSCAVSYVLVTITSVITQHIGCLTSQWAQILICILLSAVSGFVIGKVAMSQWFENFLVHHLKHSARSSALDAAVDFHCGSNLKVYLKGKDSYYVGSFVMHDGKDLLLSSHEEYSKVNNKLIADKSKDKNEYLLLNFDNIESIEIYN